MRYIFEDFALDPQRRQLLRGSSPVSLEPQVFDLLLYLITNRDRVVSREDLFSSLWRGRVVSDSALSTRVNAARAAIGDSGMAQRLIQTLPRRGLRFVGAVREQPDGAASLATGDKPAIAVLPFTNLGGDPDQDYFSDGIVEDIITALCRNPNLHVVARNSSFIYKGQQVNPAHVAQMLGVHYVLMGTVRKSASDVRVTAQLIDAAAGRHLWAERFDGVMAGIFDLQDQIVTRAVWAIAPQLEKAEIHRARRSATASPAAYDLYLQGLGYWNRWSREDNASALDLFRAAIEKDPDFATAYGLATSCHLLGKANNWIAACDIDDIAWLVERAASIGGDDAVALCWAGHARAYFFQDLDRALLLVDRSLEIDVNLAIAWQRSGWLRAYAGDADGAIERLGTAMSLNPLEPRVFITHTAMAFAHFIAGRDAEAANYASIALHIRPHWLPALRVAIAANAMRGSLAEARRAASLYFELDRRATISKMCEYYPLRRDRDRQRLITGMRKAGIPE